jgi:hypothetical protein
MQQNQAMQLVSGVYTYTVLIVAALMVLTLVFLIMPGTPAFATSTEVPTVTEQKQVAPGEPWGIRVIGIRRTAADYMLDFRFRMLDPEKAAAIMDRKIKPHLIVEKSGHIVQVPVSAKIGPLRQSPKFAKVDRNYFMFFANPGREVKAGDKVTVVIGDFKAEHLIVE